MTLLCDKHVHTTFSDGKNTPEEMVLAAISKGIKTIGFSDHSHTVFDESYCMMPDALPRYMNEIRLLKEKYEGKIQILCGIEQDFYSDTTVTSFDYVIGSVHYLKLGKEYVPVDEAPEILVKAAAKYFQGDLIALAAEYFKTVSQVVEKTGCDVIGHFDLISKFNESGKLFDAQDNRYVSAWRAAADLLLKTGALFEINTGAMARGYRSTPYPSAPIFEYISSKSGCFVLSSDSHCKESLCFGFDAYAKHDL